MADPRHVARRAADWIRSLPISPAHGFAGVLFLVCSISLVALARDPSHRCQVDEPAWITSSYLTFGLATGFAPPARWEAAYDEAGLAFWGNMNPPLGKLMTGALVALHRDPADPVDYQWQWRLGYEENQARGNIPPRSLLVPVRLGIVAAAIVTLVAIYVFAWQLTANPWAALIAPAALFLSPIFQIHATQVYMDIPQLAFLAAAAASFAVFVRHSSRLAFAVSLVGMGLSCAVKFSSAPLVFATGLFVLLRPGPLRARLRRAALVASVPLAIFVAINPYLYPDPVGRSLDFLSSWSELKQQQQRDPALAPSVVSSPLQGLSATLRASLIRPPFFQPRLAALRPKLWLVATAAALGLLLAMRRFRFRLPEPRGARGPLELAILASGWLLPFSVGATGLSLGLAALGAFWLFRVRTGPPSRELAVYLALIAGITTVATGLWLPFTWGRYYLPVLTLVAPFYAAGGAFLFSLAAARELRGKAPDASANSPAVAISDNVAPNAKLVGR